MLSATTCAAVSCLLFLQLVSPQAPMLLTLKHSLLTLLLHFTLLLCPHPDFLMPMYREGKRSSSRVSDSFQSKSRLLLPAMVPPHH